MAFAPVPVLCAPYFEQEVVGPEMVWGQAWPTRSLSGEGLDPTDVLHHDVTQQIEVSDGHASLRLALPARPKRERSASRRSGLELIVRHVDGSASG